MTRPYRVKRSMVVPAHVAGAALYLLKVRDPWVPTRTRADESCLHRAQDTVRRHVDAHATDHPGRLALHLLRVDRNTIEYETEELA